MKRRDFIKSLAIIPAAIVSLKILPPESKTKITTLSLKLNDGSDIYYVSANKMKYTKIHPDEIDIDSPVTTKLINSFYRA